MPTLTLKRLLNTCLFVLMAIAVSAQNVAINSTGAAPAASAMLDISSTTSGLLIPRMTTSQRTAIASPATGLLVYDTGTLGFWYYNGTAWTSLSAGSSWGLSGNALTTSAGTQFLGTINSMPLIFKVGGSAATNERMRISNTTSQLLVNTTSSTNTSASAVFATSATLPTALYAYSNLTTGPANHYAIYGEISNTTGNTRTAVIYGNFNAVNNSLIDNAGVRGVTNNASPGTNYGTFLNRGVHGLLNNGVRYSFGVHGSTGSNPADRVGGVLATNGANWTSIAYTNSAFAAYGIYTSNTTTNLTGSGVGRLAGPSADSSSSLPDYGIGAGIYGGVMGGWVSGQVYGSVFSGNRFGTYVQGLTITNNAIVQLSTGRSNSGARIATYAATGITQDVYAKGRGQMQSGQASVRFSADFAALIDSVEDVVVTVTPLGQSNGLYISEIGQNGFVVRENGNGTSPVAFTWIAVTTKKDAAKPVVSEEVRDAQFDQHMRDLMYDENLPDPAPGSLWWDGQQVRFDVPAPRSSASNSGDQSSSPR